MRTPLVYLFLNLVFSLPVSGSQDIEHQWQEVKLSIREEGDKVDVFVNVSAKRIKQIQFVWNKKVYSIDQSEFSDIEKPQLNTIEVKYGMYPGGIVFEEEKAYKILKMSYGDKKEFGEWPSVEFHFFDERYQYRLVTIKTGEEVFQDFKKYPKEISLPSDTVEPF